MRMMKTGAWKVSVVLLVVLATGWLISCTSGEEDSSGRSKGKTHRVGETQEYKTISEVVSLIRPGDTVLIEPGVYHESVTWEGGDVNGPPITVKGAGKERPLIDGSGGVDVSGQGGAPRALFQVEGDNYIFENLEFRNARNGNNGAGFRVTGGAQKTVIRHVKVTYCDMGMMSGNNDELLVEYSEFAFNGTKDYNGYSHNFYLGGDRSVLRYNYIHDSTHGQNFKTRGHYTELLYNYIADAHDGIDGGETTKEIGFPDSKSSALPNSSAVLIGNVIVKKGKWHQFLDFGPEGDLSGSRDGTIYLINNTFIVAGPNTTFLRLSTDKVKAELHNNIFYGSLKFLTGAGAGNVSGSHNWVPSGMEMPSNFTDTIKGDDPGFIDLAARDFRLKEGSAGINNGTNTLTYVDGRGVTTTGRPLQEYVEHMNHKARADDGKLDLGALEFVAGSGHGNQGTGKQ